MVKELTSFSDVVQMFYQVSSEKNSKESQRQESIISYFSTAVAILRRDSGKKLSRMRLIYEVGEGNRQLTSCPSCLSLHFGTQMIRRRFR